MSRPQAPWWMYVLAGVFLLTFGFNLWQTCLGPAGVGFGPVGASLQIDMLVPGGPLEHAGVRAGDIIEVANGLPVNTLFDWYVARMGFERDRPIELQLRRGNERLHVRLTIATPAWRTWERGTVVAVTAIRTAELILLLLAFLIAFSRPDQLSARLAALLFAVLAALSAIPPYGWGATVRHLPLIFSLPVTLAAGAGTFGPTLWLSFFAVFPRPTLTRRWQWALVFAPGVLCSLPLLAWWVAMVYVPARALGMSWRFLLLATVLMAAQDIAGIALLFRNYRCTADLNDRRRLRVLLLATCIGLVAAFATMQPWSGWLTVVGAVTFLVFPLGFAYAVLRHRLFDIRVIVRRGLQYALARRVLGSAFPAAVALLVLDLGLHRQQPVGAILAERGWLYGTVGVLAFLAYRNHQRWLEALDRRFFRERYNAQQLMREVVDDIRRAASFEAETPKVTARIESALHSEFVALLTREPQQAVYVVIAASPAGSAPPGFLAESKILALMRLLGKPLEISASESGWLRQQLPPEDTRFLREASVELLVPIAMAAGRKEALLVLGRKRSEEPYSREDLELLQAIASALSLLLERPAPQPSRSGYEECPQCGSVYDSGILRCALEGAALASTPYPRTLAGRYRLEKRLGRGGMGTVYRATDTALERDVALKMMREELVANPDAAERFRREAKAAAMITHPNLVSVFDFGVDSGTRAFLVMELLVGSSLRAELQRQSVLPPARASRCCAAFAPPSRWRTNAAWCTAISSPKTSSWCASPTTKLPRCSISAWPSSCRRPAARSTPRRKPAPGSFSAPDLTCLRSNCAASR